MNVLAIMATAGRHTLCERSVGEFLNQDYPNKHLLIWQNSPIEQKLDRGYDNITLVNSNINLSAKEKYNSLGEIYNDILAHVSIYPILENADIVIMFDDDDQYLPTHISEGVKGYLRGGKKAYKPAKSWYFHAGGADLISNTLEPSIFVNADHLFQYGFSEGESTAQHLKWVNPLVYNNEIFVDEAGPATLMYDWSGHHPCYKASGDPNNPDNFTNYHRNSQDHGDGIITPWKIEASNNPNFYYNLTNGI